MFLVSLSGTTSTDLSMAICRMESRCYFPNGPAILGMCRIVNGHGPNNLATRKWRTARAITRPDGATEENGIECNCNALVELYDAKHRTLFPTI